MNELQTFKHPDFGEVRTIVLNGEPWFAGKDVAERLGYANSRKALADHVDEEDKGVTKCDTPGGAQGLVVINESGLYSLILSSKLPGAKEFKRWITSDVLPSIRKLGAYMTPETLEAAILNPDTMIRLCQQIKAEQEKNRELLAANSRLTVENQIMRPKAEYFDDLVDCNLLTSFQETAKELGCAPQAFVDFLIERKYVYRNRHGKLMPYENKNDGLFAVKESVNAKTKWSGIQTLVTPKGREVFRLLMV